MSNFDRLPAGGPWNRPLQGRTVEQREQLLGNEARPGFVEVAVALGALAAAEEALLLAHWLFWGRHTIPVDYAASRTSCRLIFGAGSLMIRRSSLAMPSSTARFWFMRLDRT
jgi:hypothetical protein